MERAVLTGDFVRSRQAGPDVLARGFETLSAAAETLSAWHGAPLRPTRFRGDGWQVYLARPELSLRSALFVLASLRAAELDIDLRLAVGIGAVERLGDETLSDADGPAFHAAGAALDAMGRGRRLALAAPGHGPLLEAVTVLLDAIAQGWTAAQGEALTRSLRPVAPTQAAIADDLGIRQQSVADRLDAAAFWAVAEALEQVEGAWQPCDNQVPRPVN